MAGLGIPKDWTYYSLFVLVFTLPLEPILASVSSIIFFILVILTSDKSDLKRLASIRISYILVLYYVLACLGAFYTDHEEFPLSRLTRQLPLLFFPLAVTLLNPDQRKFKLVQKIFIAGCVLFCLLSLGSLLYNYVSNYNLRFQYNFVQSSMYHFHFPYDTFYINLAYIFLLFGDIARRIKIAVGTVFFIVVFLFGVRSGIAIFLLITLVGLLRNPSKLFTWKNALIALLFFGTVTILLGTSPYVKDKYLDTLHKLGLVKEDAVTSIGASYHKASFRLQLWDSALEVISHKPLFGYGTQGGAHALNEAYRERGMSNRDDFNSHNQYLSTTVEYGIFGLAILTFILGRSLFHSVKYGHLSFLLFIALVMLSFITESYLIRQKGIQIVALFLSLYLAIYGNPNNTHKQ